MSLATKKNLGRAVVTGASSGIGREYAEQLAERGSEFRLLTGTEVDVLKDKLDFDDDLLAELDVVVASLHVPVTQLNIHASSRTSGTSLCRKNTDLFGSSPSAR